jgi:ankyrin repeat protein
MDDRETGAMDMIRRSRAAAIIVLALSACMTTACATELMEKKIGGKSAGEVFADPKVVELVKAACASDVDRTEKLAKQGADVNYVGLLGATPLLWVMTSRSHAGVEKLLELGANPNYRTPAGLSATWFAAGGDDPKLLELMLRYRGDPNIESGPNTALEIAVEQGREANIKLLLDHGAVINHSDQVNRTAATDAAAFGRFDFVAYMLERGYTHDLVYLAHAVENSLIPADSESDHLKQRVLKMLEERGVKFPLPPVKPPPPPDLHW